MGFGAFPEPLAVQRQMSALDVGRLGVNIHSAIVRGEECGHGVGGDVGKGFEGLRGEAECTARGPCDCDSGQSDCQALPTSSRRCLSKDLRHVTQSMEVQRG